MDLPTYTNIWRIEKRLYKLYDFRLPMPLPINWIAVFAGITIPYIVLLIAIGLPFNHSLVWLYVLPPGVLTWLTTRPVIENKRLPELVESQARYLSEPRTWVRLTPLSEKDRMILSARVWRNRPAVGSRPAPAARPAAAALPSGRQARPERAGQVLRPTSVFRPEPSSGQGTVVPQAAQGQAGRQRPAAADGRPRVQERARAQERARSSARGHGQVRIAPALPTSRQASANRPAPPVIPPEAPLSAGLAAHAMPDVLPPAAHRPAATAAPAAAAHQGSVLRPAGTRQPAGPSWPLSAPQVQENRLTPPVTAPVLSQTFAPASPRVRAGRPGAAAPELSHDGPGRRRPAGQPAEQGAPGSPWPSSRPAAPSEPVRSAPPEVPSPGPGEPAPVREEPAREEPAGSLRQAEPPPVQPVTQAPSAQATPSPVLSASLAAQPVTTPEWPVPARPLRPVPSSPGEAAAAAAAPLAAMPQAPPPVTPVPASPATHMAQPEPPAAVIPEVVPAPLAAAATVAPPAAAPMPHVFAAPRPAGQASPPSADPAPPVSQEPAPEPQAEPEPAELASQAPAPAPAPAAAVPAGPAVRVPSLERALSGPAHELNASWHGKVKIVTGNGATAGPGARDQEALDRNRARLPIGEPKRILVLGCTSGAGQSVTALMTGSMLASLREHPVAAVDLHDGTLARYRAPAAWLEELLAGKPPQHIVPTRPDGLNPTPKPSPARLDVVASHEPLKDGDEIKLLVQTNRHYPLTVLDPGAAGLTRLLKITDQLVVVVPANVDAAGALADTRDWLDNNGHADLAMQSVTVINGVSRRSLPDVEHAESVARGRSRAIVRVPWDDMLPVAATGPATLRPQTRVAYTALAGVLVAGLSAVPSRKKP